MIKFEQVGVNLQEEAVTKEIAIKRFSRSCDICCTKGIHLDCDRCCISTVHRLVMANFEQAETK